MLLSVIGLGKIGTTLVKGMIEANILSNKDIIAADIKVRDDEENKEYAGIKTSSDNVKAVREADVILLAVKPQLIDKVLKGIKRSVEGKLIISVAAGISTNHLEKNLPPSCRVVRVMPNTPALVKSAISAITAGSKAGNKDLELVKTLFAGVGEVIVVEEEKMDAITGLSGSGPAYVYLIAEALADGGVLAGLPRDLSLKLAAQTLMGSAKMILETGKHPGELKDMVTSPAGTSIRAIEVLESHGLRGILIDAVKEATNRSREMNNY